MMEHRIRWADLAVEAAVCVAVVAAYLTSLLSIGLNPLDRLGQISGLASLGLRFTIAGTFLIVVLVLAVRRGDDARMQRTSRLVCAACAGLVSAMVAGGIWIALHGTPWGLNALGGDAGALASWAEALHHGKPIPPMYPPLALHILHIYSDLSGLEPGMAMKHLEILGTAAAGPAAYLSWRLLLRPGWALAIGCTTMFPLFEPYKPFPNLVLIVLIPLVVLFLDYLRTARTRDGMHLLRSAIVFGIVFGVLSLTYSGWFQWAAPGLFIATLLVFPWREGRRNALLFLGITAVCYVILTGHYMIGLFTDPHAKIVDNYIYFDVRTDPMYIAMWRNDLPGITGVWPPVGELGGAGLFTILLALGFGAAVALGRKTTVVITLVPVMIGAWLMRFYFARQLWATKLVQLYPRTTPLILYCLMLCAGFANLLVVRAHAVDQSSAPALRIHRRALRTDAGVRLGSIGDRRSVHAGQHGSAGGRVARIQRARGRARDEVQAAAQPGPALGPPSAAGSTARATARYPAGSVTALVRRAALGVALAACSSGKPGGLAFHREVIDPAFRAEGVTVFDVDHDGNLDIVTDQLWYAGPHFTPHEVTTPQTFDVNAGYASSFGAFHMDVDADGYDDLVSFGLPDTPVKWCKNPRGEDVHWQCFPINADEFEESPAITNAFDGRTTVMMGVAAPRVIGWMEPSSQPTDPWIIHPITADPFAPMNHGLGLGDLDGDGRVDLLTGAGWFRQPSDPTSAWPFFPEDWCPDNCSSYVRARLRR